MIVYTQPTCYNEQYNHTHKIVINKICINAMDHQWSINHVALHASQTEVFFNEEVKYQQNNEIINNQHNHDAIYVILQTYGPLD